MEADMTLTLPRPVANPTKTIHPATQRALRDMAFVLKLAQRVSGEIRATAGTGQRPW
jgi:hypothetical protein